ncbi:hypothetical protein CDV49_06095 [Haematobacter genomosp. 1]|uniref:Uncharacterized protein n=1 Tax=Haematobacter genomosp. 1 TaxID=366618 RepID=A0A212AE08_9RHOB|nr:hypothetical protein CDV49_06095 [Haematobacter genomosp. 1]
MLRGTVCRLACALARDNEHRTAATGTILAVHDHQPFAGQDPPADRSKYASNVAFGNADPMEPPPLTQLLNSSPVGSTAAAFSRGGRDGLDIQPMQLRSPQILVAASDPREADQNRLRILIAGRSAVC